MTTEQKPEEMKESELYAEERALQEVIRKGEATLAVANRLAAIRRVLARIQNVARGLNWD